MNMLNLYSFLPDRANSASHADRYVTLRDTHKLET